MTTETIEATPAEPAAEAPAAETTAVEAEPEAKPGNREARYRLQLRETEAERDALRGQVATFQRAEAERLATTTLADGRDLWRDGADIADVLADDGTVDEKKVAALAAKVQAEHPHWQRPAPPDVRRLRSGSTGEPEPRQSPWEKAFTRKGR